MATTPAAQAASGNVYVGASIADDLVLNMAGCPSNTATISDFGAASPNVKYITSADCSIVFGSTWQTSMLKAYQRDLGGVTMLARPTANEIGYWPLNGSGANAAKNDTTRQPIALELAPNDPAYVAGNTGYGQALEFDGNDMAKAGGSPTLMGSQDKTVELWFKSNTIAGTEYPFLFRYGRGEPEIKIRFHRDTAMLQLEIREPCGACSHTQSIPAGPLLDNNWHYVAVSYDYTALPTPSATTRLYVDGQLRSSHTNSTNAMSWNSTGDHGHMSIGADYHNPPNTYFTGQIDEVRLSDVARSAPEIESYYQGLVGDYNATTNNWAGAGSVFGACLRSVSGAGVNGGDWGVSAGNVCGNTDASSWNGIGEKATDPGTKVAASTTPGVTNATVNIRYGFRATLTTRVGLYEAPITYEVFSPNV